MSPVTIHNTTPEMDGIPFAMTLQDHKAADLIRFELDRQRRDRNALDQSRPPRWRSSDRRV